MERSAKKRKRRPNTSDARLLFVSIIGLALLFVFLINLPIAQNLLLAVDKFTAFTFSTLTNAFGYESQLSDILVRIQADNTTRSVVIGYGCDGVLAYLILLSAILPFPCRKWYKVIGALVGMVFVFIINQIRLAGLTVVLFKLKDLSDFELYHVGYGQVYAIVMVFLFWSLWASQVVKRGRRSGDKMPRAAAAGE